MADNTLQTSERFYDLDGVQVKTNEGEFGIVDQVYINRKTRIVKIWLSIENETYMRCVRPENIQFSDSQLLEIKEGKGIR